MVHSVFELGGHIVREGHGPAARTRHDERFRRSSGHDRSPMRSGLSGPRYDRRGREDDVGCFVI